MLPVLALTGGAVAWQSMQASPEQTATMGLGQNQAWIEVTGGPDPSRWQAIDEPGYSQIALDPDTGATVNPTLPAPTSPKDVLPAGTKTIEVTYGGSTYLKTATGTAHIATTTGPVWDPVFAGRYTVLEGTAPTSSSDVMVTPGLLARLGTRIGGTVTLPDKGTTLTITGTMRALNQNPSDDELFLPQPGDLLTDAGVTRWYTPGWQPDYPELQKLNHAGFVAFARDLVIHPPTGAHVILADPGSVWTLVLMGIVAAAFAGYLVVLLAGAAFAVSARRQARSLAVAASVGATRGHVFRVVLLQGAVLGLVGGISGLLLGLGATAALHALFDDGVAGSFPTGWGWKVPWLLVIAILAFAVLVGTLSAIAPARAATRGDVLGALRGSRRPAKLNPRRPLWGLGLMIVGVAAAIVGGLGIAALNAQKVIDYDTPWRTISVWAIVIGPLLFQIGMIIGGHWTLAFLSRGLSRLGLGARLASRDAAANPSRVVPAFAAIAACVFVASLALSMSAMTADGSARTYLWNGHRGAVAVSLSGDDTATNADAYIDAARSVLAPSKPAATAVVWSPAAPTVDPDTGEPKNPEDRVWTVATPDTAENCDGCGDMWQYIGGPDLKIVAAEDLATILGRDLSAADLAFYENGGALYLGGSGLSHESATIVEWAASTEFAYSTSEKGEPDAKHTIRVRDVTLPNPQSDDALYVAPATAHRLGMALQAQTMFASYAEMPTTAVMDSMTENAGNMRIGHEGSITVSLEKGPQSTTPILWIITAATMVLVLGAGAICLGLARFERRPDDATLSAVGAGPGIRRAVNAWQAVVVVGIGTVVGTVAALIPTWGIAQTSADFLRFSATPWLWLGIIAVGLPAAVAAASWLIPPRTPDLTRRTAIA